MPPPAPVLPSASFTPGLRSLIKPQTSVPPLPSRQRTANNNPGSATSASFPSRPSTKTATASGSKSSTPTIPFTGKPPTPIIPSGSTPTMTSAKPATPTIPLSSTSKTTPTVPPSAIPAHLQRKASSSSSARSVPPPPPPPSSGSGLSTKQRLAQGAMSLAPATKETTRKSLTGLSFKKNSSGSTSTTDAGVGGSGSGNTARPRPSKPPPRPTMDPLFDSPEEEPFNMIESPVEMDMDDPPSLFPQTSTISRRRSQPTLNAQAHDFLKDIMPAQPALPPRPMGVKTKMPPPKIPKKWKWTGKLLMDVTSNKANAPRTDHVCDIVLTDLFPSHVEGLRINVAMAAMQSLHLLSFHDLIDMSDFLKTCVRLGPDEPMLQLARLGPNTERDAEPLKILARYMTKRGLVSLVPVNTDNKLVGHLLLFPPVMEILAKTLFRVPSELLDTAKLISVLLPWQSFPEETRRPFGLLPSRSQEPIISRADWKKHMLAGKYQLSLRVLKFPAALHKWMSKPNRPYCIWPPPLEERKATDITVITRDHETEYLMTVLKECGAKRVGFKAEARAVFVHVGALRSISKMPALAERRRQPLGIQFYTYGTHETIHPEYWGMREIYPFGGVVTFTPTALYEDPWGVINQMKIINKHPLWTCYYPPLCIGDGHQAMQSGRRSSGRFRQNRGVFIFDLLLKAIDAGEVSVLRAPPLERNATPHWVNRPLGPRNMLEACMSAFGAKYSNIPQEDYRRYVVIRAEADNHIAEDNDGFEWLPSSKFSFDDDFPVEKVAYA
ncbi:hypothetical protein C8R46DRAFT_1089179 [Mycena filopes]|nr:hypothetical protein C8R46DRAFT_1089179 [Mycena filopes]